MGGPDDSLKWDIVAAYKGTDKRELSDGSRRPEICRKLSPRRPQGDRVIGFGIFLAK